MTVNNEDEMWQQLLIYLEDLDLIKAKAVLLAICGLVSGAITAIMGEHTNYFMWLFAFVVADWLTGFFAAMRTGRLSSRIGFKGAVRKALILFIAVGFHGLDQILSMPEIGAWAISMFCLNELISIMENIERAGFGSIIPTKVRDMLEAVQKKHENKMPGAGQQ